LAVNPADGREVWKAPMPRYNTSYATPVSWQEQGKGFVGMACAERFTAFHLDDGKEAWWVEGIGFHASSTPVTVQDRLVISAAGVQGEVSNITSPPTYEEILKKYDRDADGLIALNEIPADLLYTDRRSADGKGNMPLQQALSAFGGLKDGDKLDRKKWEEVRENLVGFRTGPMNRTMVLAVRTGGNEDVTESHVLWKETRGVPEVPSPLVWHDRLYLIRNGGLLVCRDLQTGKLIYENRIGSPGGYYASPALADGRIYVASDGGTVTVVKAGDEFEVLARNDLRESVLASPAIADNTLYIRSSKHLWAFKEKSN
jgi:outer membrane protein assembly factor BamB